MTSSGRAPDSFTKTAGVTGAASHESDPFAYRDDVQERLERPGWRPSKVQIAIASAVALVAVAAIGPPLVSSVTVDSGGGCPEELSREAMAWLHRVDDRLPGQGLLLHGGCDTEATLATLTVQAHSSDVRKAMGERGCEPPSAWQWWRNDRDCDVQLAHGTVTGGLRVHPRTGTVTVTMHR